MIPTGKDEGEKPQIPQIPLELLKIAYLELADKFGRRHQERGKKMIPERIYHLIRLHFFCPRGRHRWVDSLPPDYNEWCLDCGTKRSEL